MVAWWKPVLAVLASVGTLHAVVFHLFEDRINFFFMKLFRDVGRYKALKRRTTATTTSLDNNNKGLLAFLADSNSDNNNGVDPLRELLDLDAEQEDELHLPTYTRQELYDLGHHDTSPDGDLLLGILGRVYDVTLGDRFYGPDASYGHFSGHDVTYALATGCKSMECVQTDWTQLQTTNDDDDSNNSKKSSSSPSTVFDDKQLLEAKKWLSFFHLHDKYPLVGKLEGDSFEALVQELLAQDDDDDDEEEEEKTDSNVPDDTKSEQEMLESITS